MLIIAFGLFFIFVFVGLGKRALRLDEIIKGFVQFFVSLVSRELENVNNVLVPYLSSACNGKIQKCIEIHQTKQCDERNPITQKDNILQRKRAEKSRTSTIQLDKTNTKTNSELEKGKELIWESVLEND